VHTKIAGRRDWFEGGRASAPGAGDAEGDDPEGDDSSGAETTKSRAGVTQLRGAVRRGPPRDEARRRHRDAAARSITARASPPDAGTDEGGPRGRICVPSPVSRSAQLPTLFFYFDPPETFEAVEMWSHPTETRGTL
jgi:hypothetical protein